MSKNELFTKKLRDVITKCFYNGFLVCEVMPANNSSVRVVLYDSDKGIQSHILSRHFIKDNSINTIYQRLTKDMVILTHHDNYLFSLTYRNKGHFILRDKVKGTLYCRLEHNAYFSYSVITQEILKTIKKNYSAFYKIEIVKVIT